MLDASALCVQSLVEPLDSRIRAPSFDHGAACLCSTPVMARQQAVRVSRLLFVVDW